MVLLSHFASCFSCTIGTFLHRIRNRFEAVPGAVVLSHVLQEEIRGHFADQEMAPLTSQEVGFLLKDAFGDRYHKTRSREGNIYVGLRLKRLTEGHDHEPQIHPGHDHQPSSSGPSQAAKRVRTSEPTPDVAELQATIQRLEQQLAQEEQISYELRQQLSQQQFLTAQLQAQLETSVHQQLTTANMTTILAQELDKLVQLEEVMTCPLDKESISTIEFSTIWQTFQHHAPLLSGLIFTLGRSESASHTAVLDVHSMTILAILCQKRAMRANWFQTLVSLMLISRATNKQVFVGLNHMGLCLSYSQTLQRLETIALATEASQAMATGTWILAYDNINIHKHVTHQRMDKQGEMWNMTTRLAFQVDHLPPSEYLATAHIPQGPRSMLTAKDLLPSDTDEQLFTYRAGVIVKRLLVKTFTHFKGLSQHISKDEPPFTTHKSRIHPLAMLNIDEATTDGNIEILSQFQQLLKLDGTVGQCVVGDQLTCKNIRGAKRRRVGEVCQADTLQWAKENPGDFHFMWQCLRVLCQLYWGAENIPGSLAHLRATVGRKNMIKGAKSFKEADEFLHHALEAHLTEALCKHLNINSPTEAPAMHCETTTEWLDTTVTSFLQLVVSVPTDAQEETADHLKNFHRSFIHDAILYADLRNAIQYEDGERIISHWRWWLLYFRATGSKNYAKEAANLLANLKADFSQWMAYIVTHNRCVNTTGTPSKAKAIDMALEHHNLIIKNALRSSGANLTEHHLRVISLAAPVLHEAALVVDREAYSSFNSDHHTTSDAQNDILAMTAAINKGRVTDIIPQRTLPGQKKFAIPIDTGYDRIDSKWLMEILRSPVIDQPDDQDDAEEETPDIHTFDDLYL